MIQPRHTHRDLNSDFISRCARVLRHTQKSCRGGRKRSIIDKDRFDLFDYLTVLVNVPGGASRFLMNFRILAVSSPFLTTTLQRHSTHFPAAKRGQAGTGGVLSRVLTLHQSSRPVGLRRPFHPPHSRGNKALRAQSLRAAS